MNNEANNINNNVQPTMPNMEAQNVNQVPMGQAEQMNQNIVNPTPVNPTIVQPTSISNTATSPITQNQQISQTNVDPMSAVANLNKDEAMEEALSHTNQYSPFEASKQEVNQEVKKTSNKNAYIFIGIIFAIMLLFIIFLPQISSLFGWI